MKTYEETTSWLAKTAYDRWMGGGDSPMVGRYETSVVSFVFDINHTQVFDDILDKYNKLLEDHAPKN